jgi:crotonobetainyl-CoA:carnitine CoA-transferase CaiB-like acyl-CoA transferase
MSDDPPSERPLSDPPLPAAPRPLEGLRVLELGQLLAGPFAGTMLAYFGADVVKVEPPGGDPIRTWRAMQDGTSVWWRSLSRNKRCVVVDLRVEEGRALVRRLASASDVLLENFRPGTMEKWGLGPESFAASHPRLVYVRVSGFGQTGPLRERAGFASVCEAAAGLRHLTGNPGEPPVRANLSLGDTLGGLHAMIGLLLALQSRARTGRGQVVDVALTESVLNVMESVLPEYRSLGIVRGPSGPTITGVVPSNAYACEDGRLVVLGANTDGLFRRLMGVVGREDLGSDAALATNAGRVLRAADIDDAIGAWAARRPRDEAIAELVAAGIPAGPVNDAASIAADEHFVSRGLWERAPRARGADAEPGDDLPSIAPRLASTPGRTDWSGPELGAHTDEVMRELGDLTAAEIASLRARAIIS